MKEFFKIVNLKKYRYLLSNKSILFTKKNGNLSPENLTQEIISFQNKVIFELSKKICLK